MISWLGNLEESPSNPKRYDAYHNTVDGCSYIYDGANWTLLASKGDKGDAGTNGRSIVWKGSYANAPQNPERLWAYYNTEDGCSYIFDGNNWTNLTSKGEKGEDGRSIVWKGSLPSHPQNPEALWAYFNEGDGCSYIYDGEKWTLLSSKGDKGETGSSGADGRSIVWKGTFYAHPENPQELWTYYNATDGNAYIYTNGSWSLLMQNLAVNYDTPTIIGTVSSNGDMYSVSDVYIKVVDESSNNTIWNSLPSADGDFAVSGLDASKTYTLHFSSKRLSDVNITNSKALAATEDVSFGAIRTDVSPLSGKAQDLGSIVLSPNGTVHGSVVLGSDSKTSGGVDVFLDGTPYAAKTDSNGEYTIKDVLQGSYSIVFRKDGYITQSRDMVVFSSDSSEVPSIEVQSVKLVMGSCTLKGTVGYEDITDMSGINVVLIGSGGDVCRTSMTEKDGSFSFEGISPDTYAIRAGADGYTIVDRRISISIGESYVVPMGSLVNLCGSIAGSVTTNDSGLKSGVKVKASSSSGGHSYETITDEAGLYLLSNVLHGDYVLTFEKEGYETCTSNVTVEPGRTSTADAQLKSRFGSIRVVVSFVDKDDPTGIVVNVYRNGTLIFSATTTSTGIIVIANLPIGDGYSVIASSDGYGSSGEDKVTVSSGTVSELNLQKLSNRYGSLKGRVVDANGNPIESATVGISSNDGNSYTLTTSKDGTFSKTDVAVGTYTVSAGKADFLTTTLPQTYTVEPSLVTEIKDGIVLVSKYANIAGSVQYADKEDSSNISVTIEDDKGGTLGTVVTGETGSYSFKVESGTYYIRANAQGYFESSKVLTVVTGHLYTINLDGMKPNHGSIAGKVVDADGNAVSGAVVNLTNMDGVGDAVTLSTNENGEFSSSTVPIGTYTVSITKSGYIDIVCNDVPIVGGRTYDVGTKTLVSGTAGITGRVVLEGASNYSGVTVSATSLDDSSKLYTTTTTEDGLYYFVSLDVGTWLLKFQKDGYLSVGPEQVPLVSDKIEEVKVVTLRNENSIVKGTVSLKGSSSFLGVNVLLKNSSDETTFSTTTDIEGRYVISNVKPGSYELVLSKEGYSSATMKDLYVDKGTTKVIDEISLDIAVTSIKGQVSLELRTDFSGALVTATSISNPDVVYSAITNSQGTFTFAKMYSGEYQIVVSCNGYSSITLPTVKVVDDKPLDVGSVSLKIERGTIAGIARLEGHSNHSGVKVTILGTGYEATTAADGSYSFDVPAGNYPGGLRLEYEDFETTSYASTIPVLTNSTYAIPDIQLRCLNVPRVYGKVTIYGLTRAEYDGITVKIAELPSFSYTTDKDGGYSFEHVPVGTYTLEFTRENARKVTKIVAIEPAPSIAIEDIELIPDAVTLYGNISMDGVADYSGATVRITTPGSVELKTMTNAAGYWYIGNVVASKSHAITFEKEGWDSQSYDIEADRYEPLALVDYNSEQPVVMKDTTAPVVTNISANIGRSTENGREVYLYLYTNEKGSGIKWIQGTTADSFDGVEEQSYYNPFTLLIPDEVGEYTLHVMVKDGAGNISDAMSTNIVVKNDKTELYSELSGEKLHLTVDNSPYLMTNDVLVPEGKTLTIDPGVEIQVNGDFFIQVEGSINAIGTEDKRIKIYGVEDGAGNWKGIKFIRDEDSRISYVDISGLTSGISGRCDIDHALVTANGFAIGYKDNKTNSPLKGDILDSSVNGNICIDNGFVYRNRFDGDAIYLRYSNVERNVFEGESLKSSGCFIYNNNVSMSNVSSSQDIQKCVTYNTSDLQIGLYDFYYSKEMKSSSFSYVQFNNCTFSKVVATGINNSNFINCGDIVITTDRKDVPEFDMTGNYWGDVNTAKLNASGEDSDLSFIYDRHDDFNLAKVLYSAWKDSPVANAGYHEEESDGSYSGYVIGDVGPAGGLVFYDKGYYSDGWRYLEAAPSDIGIGVFVFGYYRPNGTTNRTVGTVRSIGAGRYNTEMLVRYMDLEGKAYSDESGNETDEYAAKKCLVYSYGGYNDWYLPSKDEVNLLCENLNKNGSSSFPDGHAYYPYCSSSESEDIEDRGWFLYFNGYQDILARKNKGYVRPIRAF